MEGHTFFALLIEYLHWLAGYRKFRRFLNLKVEKYSMAVLEIYKTSEKVILWLHRTQKTQQWLADELGQKKSAINGKIKGNCFTLKDIVKLKELGCLID